MKEILKKVIKVVVPIAKESATKDMQCSNCGHRMNYKEAYTANIKHMCSGTLGLPRIISNKTNLKCPKCGKTKCWVDV